MKRIVLFALMLVIAASCSVTEIDSIQGTTAPEITASYGDNGTRTILITDDEGVGTIWWKPADEINVFYETASAHYTSKNTENATTVSFSTTDILGSTESAQGGNWGIWGLYPYDENAVCDGESVTTTISALQKGVAETFDDDLFTSLAHSNSTTMTFYNVLGGIKFSLSRDDIKTITFKGNNNEDIAGKVKLKMDANDRPVAETINGQKIITLTPKEGTTFAKNTNYYLVMLPTVLSNGFTMTFETEDKVGTFEYTENPIEIKRSVFSKKENIDSYATFEDKDYKSIPFTISSIGSTSVALMKEGTPDDITLEYRKGYGKWRAYTIGSTISLANGEFVQFRAGEGGNEYFSKDPSSSPLSYHFFNSTGSGNISVSGNIMSLLDQKMESMSLKNDSFSFLFDNCEILTDASNLKLPATTLGAYCYYAMFHQCSSLQTAPELPATTLAESCYASMFSGCRSLQTAPELPATDLTYCCYEGMFSGCLKLQTAPELPATTLAEGCYASMFSGCSFQTAPELPATKLAKSCYSGMFSFATLETAPKLPATTLAEGCYRGMFRYAKLPAPELPATTLANSCYERMFYGCTSLQTAPELPATTLDTRCYESMFSYCTSLQTAPELPATNLDERCYGNMFSGCSSLQTAPALPATTLAPSCYSMMFYLSKIQTAPEILPATTLDARCYESMFYGCSSLQTHCLTLSRQ